MNQFKETDIQEKYGEKGFTLIEILISLAIMSIVTIAIYQLYISQYKTWISQDLITEMQQNGRVAIDTMSRDYLMAGYGVDADKAVEAVVTTVNDNKISVRYRDPSKTLAQHPITRVMYWRGSDNVLYRYELNKDTQGELPWPVSWTVAGQPLAENVTALEFTYFKQDGTSFTPDGSIGNEVTKIYRIKVSVKVRTSKKDPITKDWKYFTLSTDVRPRNIGITGAASDTTPPAVPTGLESIDPGECGTLRLKWTPNTEVDLAGYRIYYALASRSDAANFVGYRSINVGTSAAAVVDLPGLTTTLSNAATPTIYYISVAAFDSSGNVSGYSAEVAGNPDPNTRAFTGSATDTTINIPKPAKPTGFTGTAGPLDNEITLSWDVSADPNLKGYRLYRRTSPFTVFPVVPDTTNTILVADENQIGAALSSFVDHNAADSATDKSNLIGCTRYYYAIVPITTCDTTLINNYTDADYALTDGDGAGGAADTPANSNTMPTDNTAPGSPTVVGRAGWRRVAITFKNPTSGDFSRSCLYVEKGGVAGNPTFDAAKDANGCFNVVNPEVGTRGLIPDASPDTNSNGIFTNTSPVTFWHDSMTERTPASPNLAQAGQEVQTYAYRAVSFDRCGNPRNLAAAISATSVATTNLCGEDPPSGEKPPAPGLPATPAVACGSPATISWTPVSSDIGQASSITNPWDLAGYRIFRSSSTDFNSAILMNPAAPYWCEATCSYPDSLAVEGGTYYYKIASTDCPYEKVNPSEATIKNSMLGIGVAINSTAAIGPVTPGRIDRDDQAGGHPEVLALDSRGDAATDPTKGYHNQVKLYLRNTSAGTMSITAIPDIRWGNTSARLASVKIGGSSYPGNVNTTTQTQVWAAGSAAELLGTCTAAECAASVTLSIEKQIGTTDFNVPIIFEFTDVNKNVNEIADMRGDTVFRMRVNVRNDSTGTTGCVTYLTLNEENVQISVPSGPVFTIVSQNTTTTDLRGSSTSAGYWTVGAGLNVNVVADVADNSGVGIASVKLYYAVTERTVTSAPTSFLAYTERPMSLVGGISYQTTSPIPASPDKRIWYYIIARDNQGNFDREPDLREAAPDVEAYTYDHQAGTPCSVTPKNPTTLLGTTNGVDTVNLSWTAATQYTSDDDKYSSDEFKYRIYRRDSFVGAWNQIAEVSSTSYTDTGLTLSGNKYSYYVKTINKCVDTTPACTGYSPWPASPPKCLSTESNAFTECVGGGAVSLIPGTGSILAGGSFNLTAFVCDLATGDFASSLDEILVHDNTAPFTDEDTFTMVETGLATGEFIIKDSLYGQTIITTSGTGYCTSPTGLGDVCLWVNPAGGTITFDNMRYDSTPDGTVNPTDHFAAYATVAVQHDPCSDTPVAPTGLVVNAAPNCASDRKIELRWTANSESDVVGYDVYEITPAEPDRLVCSTNSRTATSCTNALANVVNTSDAAKLDSKLYQWVVKARDSCSTPKVSAASATLNDPCN